jgi:hypothetical protein
MTENFEEKLSRLTELLEKQIEAYADLNDTTKKTEEQQKKALESSILEAKGYKRVSGEIISIEEERIKAEEKLTQELYDNFGKEKVINQKIQDEYNKQLKSITDVIKGSIEITDAQKQNLLELKKSNEYIAAQQASEFKKQAEALGAIVQSNGKLLEVNNKIITDSIKLSDEQKKQLAAAKMAQDPGKAVGDMANRYKDTSNTLTDFSNKLQESASSSVGWTSTIQMAEAAISGMAKGITVFTSSIYKGERGATVTANALNELTKSVGDTMTGIGTAFAIFSWFMPGGAIFKGLKIVGGLLGVLGGQLIKGYGELQKLGAEQNDALFKAYNRLSASGLGAAKGLEGVIDTVHTLNMSVPEIEKFTELLTNNSKELKLLGATAGEGAQNFAKVAGELSKSKIGEQLERLGVTAEEQREHTLRYMTQQTRMGMAQGKTQQELLRGSQQYIEELDKIAMLTGASRKDQEEARAAIMAENELRAAMYEAEKNKDTELSAKLKQAFDLAANLRVMGDTRGATGVSKYAAAGFNPTDEISGAAMQTYTEALTNISQGKGGSASANLTTALKGLQTSMDNYAGAAKYGGDFKALQSVDMAKGADMVLASKRFEEEKLKNPSVTIDQVLELMQRERMEADPRLKATVEGNRMQQAAAQIMDKAAFQYNDAAKIHAAASTKFKEAVDTFAKVVGAKPVAGGTNVNSGTTAAQPAPAPAPIPVAPNAPPNAGASQMGGMADQRRQGLGGASQGIPTPLPPNMTPRTRGVKPSGAAAPFNAARDSQLASSQLGILPPTPGPGVQVASNAPGLPKTSESLFTFGSKSGSKSNFEQLSDSIRTRIITAAKEFNSMTGSKIAINSAKRDSEDQQRLWDESVTAGRPGIGPTGKPIGKPGTSKHERGLAVDIQNYNDPNAVTAMNKQGLFQTVPNDPVHFEMARFGGVFSGPTSGYPVMLHGEEVAMPKPQFDELANSAKKESITTAFNESTNVSTSTSSESSSAILQELLDLMEDKFDAMISQLSTGNDISDKLLRNSMV